MDLVWHPGEAQADFGEVDVLLRGVVQRMHHFVLDFPYSNVGLVQLMPGENAECTCLALRNLFEWLAVCRSGSCSITPPAWAIRGTGSASRA